MPDRDPFARSIWWQDDDALPSHPPLHGDLDVEIAVVGGGITGIGLACTLAERGASVAVLEAGRLAGGATGRSAGFLLAGPGEPYRELIALWGRDGARAFLLTGRRSHQRVRELVATLGIECDHRANGSLRLARTEEEAEDQRASLPELHADGFKVLETRVAGTVPPGAEPYFRAAFVTAEDGELDPVRFVHGLASAAVARGARLHEHTTVEGARWSAGLWETRTATGRVRSRVVVLATNAYTPRLVPALGALIAPRRGQMLCTAPLPAEIVSRPTSAHWGYQYWRQLPDRRLVIGGWRDTDPDGDPGWDDRPSEPIQSAIERGLAELVPDGAGVEARWAGTMGFARDGRPLAGWLDPEHHVAICAGFTGHGLSLAPACTLDLADLLEWKAAPGIATFDPARFAELRKARESLVTMGSSVGA